jgi:hypothetical protein
VVDEVENVDEGIDVSEARIALSTVLEMLNDLMDDEEDSLTVRQAGIISDAMSVIEEALGPSDASEDDDAEEGMEAE